MPIVCVGINYRTAPVALRERLSFGPGQQAALLRGTRLRDFGEPAGLREFALLSTCNRTELYAAAPDVTRRFATVPQGLAEGLAAAHGLPAAEFADHLYVHTSTDAVRHLCRVASGLDSMVLGESEILGQVADAHELARREGAAGRVLGAVFHTALRAGRRARTETGICRCPMSVSSESVRALRESGWEPEGSRVLIVGTGKMSRLAGEVLRAHGVRDLRVVGRTAARAESVARALDARPLAWHLFEAALREVDVVFCSTSAPHAVVTRERVVAARAGVPAEQPLRFIDIAVPRDVEPAVRDVPGVTVFDLDDLQRRLVRNLDGRRREVPAVEALVDEELRYFEEWRHGAELRPLLAAMHQHSEEIRQREVARALRRLKGVGPEVEAQLEAFSRSLVNKLLHEPTRRLRDETDPDLSDTYVRVARDLFGLAADGPADRTEAPPDAREEYRGESAA
ncbi:MAG TPA: glutamyl-tRNA reductase [Gemmatimonadales bacterium]|jgi:glutamyl-tRNA reductase